MVRMGFWIIKRPRRRARVGWSISRGVGCALGWTLLLWLAALVVGILYTAGPAMDAPPRSPAAIEMEVIP